HETALAFDQMSQWPEKYCLDFSKRIIDSIPPGSIYFGGTDAGRALITVMCKSQIGGDPFLTLSPNHLIDSAYMDYLRAMYNSMLDIPTGSDIQQAFREYLDDAVARTFQNKLKPGENVTITNNQPSVQGLPAIMGVNAIMLRKIFQNNP